jgi:phosphatidylglycerophosphate synthase
LGDPIGGETASSLLSFDLTVHDGTGQDPLRRLAALAQSSLESPLVVIAGELEIGPVALLDLLDGPADRTSALTVDRTGVSREPKRFAPVRVSTHDRRLHSVGTAHHLVTSPTAYSLGVLRVRAADRARAAELWQAAAGSDSAQDPVVEPFDLALLALVRGGLPVTGVSLGPYTARRGADHTVGASGSAWQQRLRGASRGNDGAFSMAVVRPISRRLTAVGLRHGWAPNVVTLVSLMLGLAAGALVAVDHRVAWLVAALLLQASLVVDCVDGEIARFTRRYSPLGGWLDAVSDRVKEFAVVMAVAWVAARRGEQMWILAIALLGLLAIRHVEDHAYARRGQCSAPDRPDLLDVDAAGDLGAPDAPTSVPPAPRGRALAIRRFKQVLHLPVAERYLILSVGLLTFNPQVLMWALTIAVLVALAWTQLGRVLRAVLHHDAFDPTRPDPDLSHLLDLGPLDGPLRSLAARVARWRLGWQVPWLLVAAETAAVVVALGAVTDAGRWVGYAWLAAVTWHRYDLIYRLRETGRAPAAWVGWVTLGSLGRIALLLVAWGIGWPVAAIMGWAALALACAYGAETVVAWRAASRASRPADRR